MELLLWIGLCVLLGSQIVSARIFKREVSVDCNNFSSMMQDAKICIYQHDNSRLASGLVLESVQLERLLLSRCRALPEIRNCVKQKYGSCPNLDAILDTLWDDDICHGDQPSERLSDWIQRHPLEHVNDNCAGEIDTCTIQDWILDYMVTDFDNLRFNESRSLLYEYANRLNECVRPLLGEGAVCDGIKYGAVAYLIFLQVVMMPLQILGDMMAD